MNSIGSLEISITTWARKADEATKLEYSTSDIEKCTIEKDAVVAKDEAAKDLKIGTNTGMKKYLRSDKCGKYFYLIQALPNQFTGATRASGGGWCGGRGYLQAKDLLNVWNTEKYIWKSRWGYQTANTFNKTTNLKNLSVTNATKINNTTYVGGALT